MSSSSTSSSSHITPKRNQDQMNYGESSLDEGIHKKQKLTSSSGNAGGANGSSGSNGESSGVASKVLHVRSLPADTTEQELISIASPFGRVMNVLLLKGKNQAFVQMENEASATALVDYYNSVRAVIRGKAVYFQYSSRGEISAPAATPQQEVHNHILLVTVLNVVYPVTIDVLQRVFEKYGPIQKIIIFSKSGTFQSLIQFADVASAVAAKNELDSQNIYAGCCTLRIQYSSLPNLNVKFNNDKSRDFTNPSLPSGPLGPSGAGGMPADPVASGLGMYAADPSQMTWWSMAQPATALAYSASSYQAVSSGKSSSGGTSAVLIVSGLDEMSITPDALFTLFGVYGDVIRVKIMYQKKHTALIQFPTPQQAETAMNHLNGLNWRGHQLKINFSKYQSIAMPKPGTEGEASNLTKDFTNSPLHRYKVAGSKNFQHITQPSQVLHVSNLPQSATEEAVREVFSNYGAVTNFKFFPNNIRMCLIEMNSLQSAVEALIGLHDFKMGDQNIRVSFSKSTL